MTDLAESPAELLLPVAPAELLLPSAPTRQAVIPRLRGVLVGLALACRPWQWSKQVFVIAAPLVGGSFASLSALGHLGLAVIAFCLAASAGYLHNDIGDVAADRAHPRKCRRPIASGQLPVPVARVACGVLILAAVGAAYVVSWQLTLVVAIYEVLTLTYTSYFKHMAVVDVVAVAGCFVVRAIGGAVAVDVPVTHWFFVVVTVGSLYLVSGKREAEMRAAEGNDRKPTRASLRDYSVSYLTMLRTVSLAAVLTSYIGWALIRDEAAHRSIPWFAISVVPFLIAILRYALRLDRGLGEEPEDILKHDRPLVVSGLAVALLVGIATYVH